MEMTVAWLGIDPTSISMQQLLCQACAHAMALGCMWEEHVLLLPRTMAGSFTCV